MKSDGVTTMVLFTDAAMNKAMMEQATKQEWFPEWFHTGNSYADYSAFAKTLPPEQAAHFFGISGSSPYLTPPTDPETTTKGTAGNPLDWFWGPKNYTSTARLGNGITWLLQGIHAAGPDLTPKTFKQGQFSVPARGGSASNSPFGAQVGLREDDGSAVRRVQPGARRLPAVLDGARRRGGERDRDGGEAVVVVREQRAAVPGRHVSDQEGRVVRQGQVGRVVRHAAPAVESTGPDCM